MTAQDIFDKLIESGMPEYESRVFTAIAKGESGFNPESVYAPGNETLAQKMISGREYSVGLFQINIPAHYDKLERLSGSKNPDEWVEWLKNPINNIKIALEIYKGWGNSFKPWSVYTSGNYKKYWGEVENLKVNEKSAPGEGGGGGWWNKGKNVAGNIWKKYEDMNKYRHNEEQNVFKEKIEEVKEFFDWKDVIRRSLIILFVGGIIIIFVVMLFKNEIIKTTLPIKEEK